MATKTIPASEFKAKCLALMDEVAETGDEVVITKRGRVVARLVGPASTNGGHQKVPPAKTQRPVPDLRGSILYEAEDAWESHPEWWRPGPHKLE